MDSDVRGTDLAAGKAAYVAFAEILAEIPVHTGPFEGMGERNQDAWVAAARAGAAVLGGTGSPAADHDG